MSTPLLIPISVDPDARPFSNEELTHHLSQLDRRSNVYRALVQLLDTHFAQAVGNVTAPRLTEREAGMAAGEISAFLTFRADFKARCAAPH